MPNALESGQRDVESTSEQRIELILDITEGEFVISQMNELLSLVSREYLSPEEISIFEQIAATAKEFVDKKRSEIRQLKEIHIEGCEDARRDMLDITQSLGEREKKAMFVYYGTNPKLPKRYLSEDIIGDLNYVRKEFTPGSALIRTAIPHRTGGIMSQ